MTLKPSNFNTYPEFECVAINDEVIVGGAEDGYMCIYANSSNHASISTIQLGSDTAPKHLESSTLMYDGNLFINREQKTKLKKGAFMLTSAIEYL